MFGLIKDLVGMLNPLSLNTSIFPPIDHYQEVLIWTCLLRSPRKGLINIKNKDEKCFLWCHIRHINPSKEHPERIKKTDRKIAEKLNYNEIEFPVQEKDLSKIEVKNISCINVFGYENGMVFPIYISEQNFKSQWICCF